VLAADGSAIHTRRHGRLFAHTFIPIALAYLVAHYFTVVVGLEPRQLALLFDPLGEGAAKDVGVTYVGATATWYVQVGALVVGHVLALVMGHDRALEVYGDPKTAARSQYWMLALMVGFTSLGLFLLSQSNA
jgi:hypothetical protein